MDDKPSPGPWTWEAEYDGRYRTYRLKSADPTANDIAFGFDDGLHCDNPADRALIAKAPTLSAELAEAIELLDESRYDTEGTDFGERVMRFLAKHGVK